MNCAACGTALTPVSHTPSRRATDWTVQYHDAFAMTFLGGYGMLYDFAEWEPRSRDHTAVLCEDCGRKFVAANPWALLYLGEGHPADTELWLDLIRAAARRDIRAEAVEPWLDTIIPELDNQTPRDMVALGRGKAVIDVLNDLHEWEFRG